jgi:hypothetical protein
MKPTNRRQFVLWLIYQLNRRGETLTPESTYADIMSAVLRLLERAPR